MAIYFQKFELPLKSSCAGGSSMGSKKHELEHRAGLGLLRECLFREFSEAFPCAEGEFCLEDELTKGEQGKPFLKAYPQIHFNISHGKDMVVCGVGDSPLGVDVEAVRPVKKNIFRRVLTEKEQDWLRKSEKYRGEDGWYRDFFRLWTLKESYAKAMGKGLAVDFTSLEFLLSEGEEQQKREGNIFESLWLFPGRKEKEMRWKNQDDREGFPMEEVLCSRLEGEEKAENTWRFFQTILDREYVISCCVRQCVRKKRA